MTSALGRKTQPSYLRRPTLGRKNKREQKLQLERETAQNTFNTRLRSIKPKTLGQKEYLSTINDNTVTFCIGPAGTGKTYLAMVYAIRELVAKRVDRIVLVRPAVEAGERLGHLPGTLEEKVSPYLRPLLEVLEQFYGSSKIDMLRQKNIIEICPIAFMRGRTLSNCIAIMDEAQNTTEKQMFMFLTRLGENTKAIIAGDTTQIDLRRHESGLLDAERILSNVENVGFAYLDRDDIVRAEIVQNIIDAYEASKDSDTED